MARAPERSPLLPLAILAILLACGFTIEDGVVNWYWEQTPWIAPILVATGVALGTMHFLLRRRQAGRGHTT